MNTQSHPFRKKWGHFWRKIAAGGRIGVKKNMQTYVKQDNLKNVKNKKTTLGDFADTGFFL